MKWWMLFSAWFAPSMVFACDEGAKLVFACTTTKGKYVEVCQAPKEIHYAFGTKGKKPEMRITHANERFLWQGGGGSGMETDGLTFANGKTRYVVSYTNVFDQIQVDGSVIEGADEAGLAVFSGDKELTSMICSAKGLAFNPELIIAKRTAYRN